MGLEEFASRYFDLSKEDLGWLPQLRPKAKVMIEVMYLSDPRHFWVKRRRERRGVVQHIQRSTMAFCA